MKILEIITKGDWAGAQRVLYDIVEYSMDVEDTEIHVAFGLDQILGERLRELGVKVHVIKNLVHKIDPLTDLKGYREIKELIKREKYDVVHCHSTKAGILGRLAAHSLGVKKIIYTVHGWWPILRFKGIKRNLAISVERFCAKRCDTLVLLSQSDKELTRSMKIGEDNQYRIIYNSIDKPEIDRGILYRELNIPEDTRIIGNISRVGPQKNPELFLAVAIRYFELDKDARTKFVWIGNGELLQDMRMAVRDLKMEDKIIFPGFRDNGARYMGDFDMLFMTSNWEGVPITILEAVHLKINILSSDVGGIKEVIGEECTFNIDSEIDRIVQKIQGGDLIPKEMDMNMVEEYQKLFRE